MTFKIKNISGNLTKTAGFLWILLFALAGILLRLTLTEIVVTPDSRFFEKIAANLVQNGCYALSDPSSSECVPTWGSQPPGYPVYIALIKIFPVDTFWLAATMQVLLFSVACAYALWASYLWHRKLIPLILTALALCLSPASIGWSQWILTETLAAAAALWLFGEIFRSLSSQRLRTLPLGLALLTATWLRWDMVFLVIPILLTAIYLEGSIQGIVKTVGTCLPTTLLIFSLVLRALIVGLPLVPDSLSDPSIPPGLIAFWKGGARTQGAASDFFWPIWARRYGKIKQNLDYSAFHKDFNSPDFMAFVEQIDQLPDGTRLPSHMDNKLGELAAKAQQSSNYSRVGLIADRAINIWAGEDPIAHSGWRSISGPRSRMSSLDLVARIHRSTLLFLGVGLLLFVRNERALLVSGMLLFCILRTVFLSSMTALEIRYLAPMIPAMELVLVAVLTSRYLLKIHPTDQLEPSHSTPRFITPRAASRISGQALRAAPNPRQ